MASNRVGDMSIDELRSMIYQIVDERTLKLLPRRASPRSVKEIMDSIDRHRIKPPDGSQSNVELIREDRDR